MAKDTGWRQKVIFILLHIAQIQIEKHDKTGGVGGASDLTQGLTSPRVCEARILYQKVYFKKTPRWNPSQGDVARRFDQ